MFLVHGGQQIRGHRLDMLCRLLQLDVDQRERFLCRLHLQMGSGTAYLVGKRPFIPDRSHGYYGYFGKVGSAGTCCDLVLFC
jgi:hypothetical protein